LIAGKHKACIERRADSALGAVARKAALFMPKRYGPRPCSVVAVSCANALALVSAIKAAATIVLTDTGFSPGCDLMGASVLANCWLSSPELPRQTCTSGKKPTFKPL
jgi:hypothetical protein